MSTPPSPQPTFNVFISWAGQRSRAVASALSEWIPSVVQAARPWMSSENIESGQRWRDHVSGQLESIQIGILCLCPENQTSTAIHFEAGALSRLVNDQTRLIPYCFGLRRSELKWPLGDFQAVEADKDGTRKLVQSINAALSAPIPDAALMKCFEALWEELQSKLAALPPTPTEGVPRARTTEDMVAEVLDRVRSVERQLSGSGPGDAAFVYRDPQSIDSNQARLAALAWREEQIAKLAEMAAMPAPSAAERARALLHERQKKGG